MLCWSFRQNVNQLISLSTLKLLSPVTESRATDCTIDHFVQSISKSQLSNRLLSFCVTEPCSQGFLGIIFSVSNECVDDMTKYSGTVYTVFQLLLFAVSSPIQELVFLLYPYRTVIFEWYTCTFSLPRLVPRSATACTVSYKGLESA